MKTKQNKINPKCSRTQKPLTGSEIRACLKKRLTGTRKKPLSFGSDYLGWKDLLLSYCWWGKPGVRLAAHWLYPQPVDLQTHLSFTFDTRRTFFSLAASKLRTCLPKSRTWRKTVSPLATDNIKNTNWTYHPLLKTPTLDV